MNVANYTDGRIKMAMCGVPSFRFGTAAADANESVQVEELSGDAQFVVLIGFGGAMPVHFWMGMTGGEDF